MISANQQVLVVLVGLVLAFSFPVDATQVQNIKSASTHRRDVQAHADPVAIDGEEVDDKDSDDDSTANESPVYQVKSIKTRDSEGDNPTLKNENLRLELVGNLRKQSSLKRQIKHLTNESESDQEIEDSAKLVANETESVEMAEMLSNMWKEMRMFDVPAYEKHVEHELHHLKEDEEVLEAKLKGKHVEAKLKGEYAEDDEEAEDKEKDGKKDKEEEAEEAAVKVLGFGGQASTVNFWRMSRANQMSILSSTLVYLIGGVLFAFLFKQMRDKYFSLEVSLDGHPNKKGFSFPIFGCLGAGLKLCALGFFCPCLAWANTVERRLKVSYWQAFLAFFGLLLLHVYTIGISSIVLVILGVFYRQKLRNSYEVDSFESGSKTTLAFDFLLWCFCQPCVIIQEAREETANHGEKA